LAQNTDCEKVISFLNEKESQIEHLNLYDPDYIPLHYLLAQDILKKLETFKNEEIPHFISCFQFNFNQLIDKYDNLYQLAQQKYDSLAVLNKKVHLIFYRKALLEYQFKNEIDGNYFLQRSLQYNETFPNALLLKLNKLLQKSCFEECLSLLNTLYYETELDDEQEKEAILFTDIFYDKLYRAGDSLIKLEHAAEALELFEILERFCLNLPSAYCNDDYYHGVLRSKTGIYESYITIARVAKERGNPNISAQFYKYAQEYLDANPHLRKYEGKVVTDVTEIERTKEKRVTENTTVANVSMVPEVANVPQVSQLSKQPPEKKAPTTTIIEKKETITEIKTPEVKEIAEPVVEVASVSYEQKKVSAEEIKNQYDKLVLDALALCIQEKFKESYNQFLEAKKLEECNCFKTDFRVDLMLNELSRFIR
jgi:hypothetical protein